MRIRRLFSSIPGAVAVAVIVCAAVTAGIGFFTFDLVHHEIERQIDHRIELETDALVAAWQEGGLKALTHEVQRRDRRTVPGRIGYLVGVPNDSRMMGVLLADAQGRRIAGSLQASVPEPGWHEFLRIRRADGSTGVAQAINTVLPDGNQLVVAADRLILQQTDRRLATYFLSGLGLILLVCAAAAFGVGRFVQYRLRAISDTANAIIAGDIQRRIRRDGSGSEFDRLSEVLNRMLDRISGLLSNLRQVTENIAHDMRTPLHRLRQKLEAVEGADGIEGEDVRRSTEETLREVDKLLELFSSLLAISEIDGFQVRARFVRLDLADVAREVVEAYLPAFRSAHIEVAQDFESVWVQGDRSLLQQCVANFLDNVFAHAAGATRVEVSVFRSGNQAHLRVRDNGAGIPEEERRRIFERFVRLDPARSSPGHGLGLSLVASIASAHHGAAEAIQTPQGLAVELRLPALAAPASP